MKNLAAKLLPLISKLIGKKPVVILLSVLAIGAYYFAVHKGYLQDSTLDLNSVINYLDSTFKDAPVDTAKVLIDSVSVK